MKLNFQLPLQKRIGPVGPNEPANHTIEYTLGLEYADGGTNVVDYNVGYLPQVPNQN